MLALWELWALKYTRLMATRLQTNAWYAAPSTIDHGERQPEFTNYCKDRSLHKTTFSANMLTFTSYFPSLDVFIYLFSIRKRSTSPTNHEGSCTVSPLVYFFPFGGRHVPAKIAHITWCNPTHADLYTLFVFIAVYTETRKTPCHAI